jgi:carbon-monoxide dehydrogenase large subunit
VHDYSQKGYNSLLWSTREMTMVFSKLIGAEVKRKEDPRMITGKGTYTPNLKLAGMHHVTFVRSPYAHAQIGAIDTSAALSIPGVVAVITGEDLKASYKQLPVDDGNGANKLRSRYPLALGRVRHAGEVVAAVIATSADAAADAVSEVMVDWDLLPVVTTIEQALDENSPVLFDDMQNNILSPKHKQRGDVDAAFAKAFRVVKQRIMSQRLAAVPMEGRAVVAAPDPANDGLTVWTSTQTPHVIRTELAKSLGFAESLIRVIAPDVGGGFGVKIGLYAEEIILAALALRLQLPLKWVEDRMENLLTTTHGRAQQVDMELAVMEDGTVTGLRMDVVNDLGAYPMAPWLPDLTAKMSVGVYHIPAVDIKTRCVVTNTTPVAAYRGAGRPEAAYYIERMMDIAAHELGIDPVEIRRKNFIPPSEFPYKSPAGATYDSGDYEKALAKAIELSRYAELRAEQASRPDDSETIMGIGVSTFVEVCADGPYESAVVRVEPTGSVTVHTGIMPHGQGQATTFAQIVADEIGADYERIIVKYGDTATAPVGSGTYGSRGLTIGGMALLRVTTQVRAKAQQIAAHMLEAATEDIVLENGQYQVRGVPSKGLTLAEIADRAYTTNLPEHITSGLEATDFYRPSGDGVFPFGAHIVVVEIERETGIVHLRDYTSIEDCGPRISPTLVLGQIHGGLAQGIGQALWEEIVYDEQGQMLTGTLMDYAIPHSDSFPHFRTGQTETPSPLNPMGVKGIGEAATIGSTPAVVNAVMDALKQFGVEHIDMPLRAEKVWRAIQGN